MSVSPLTQIVAADRPGWFRPFRVGRFAVLLEPAADRDAALANMTSLGGLVWPHGADVDPEAPLPAWPADVRAPLTQVFASRDAGSLYIRVICHEPAMDRMRLDSPDLWRNDHVSICLDPLHDHWRYFYVMVLPDGRSEASWKTVHYGYIPADTTAGSEPAGAEAAARVQRQADGWTAEVTFDLTALGVPVADGQCLGLNVNRWRTIGSEQFTQWSPTFGVAHDARCFGDLYLGRPAAILQEIHLGGPHWGPNRGYARFVASRPFQASLDGGEAIEPAEPAPQVLRPGVLGNAAYEFEYRIDPREIMEGRLTLRWCAAGADDETHGAPSVEARASFVFGWKRSVLLTHAAGRSDTPGRPSDGRSPDFFARMCDYLLARLPRLRREGGRHIVADNGLRIDLLDRDPLLPLAEAVAQRIEGMDDQLAACALILCQKDVLISSGTLARVGHACSPATLLWNGGGFCDQYSYVLAALVDRLAALQKWYIRTGLVYMYRPDGAPPYWPNHYWAGVWLDRGVTILDAELGRFFYRADGRLLATLDDLFADPSLAEAAGRGQDCYFRLHTPRDVLIKSVPLWRDTRPT